MSKEWPQSAPPSIPVNWQTLLTHVRKSVGDAMNVWNPLGDIAVSQKDCGFCPCHRDDDPTKEVVPALEVRPSDQWCTTVGYHEPSDGPMFLLWDVGEEECKHKMFWRHEWGHVLGFFHEHQRPDLWEDGWFKLRINYFPGYDNFFTHYFEDGVWKWTGEVIPEHARNQMNGAPGRDFDEIPAGARFDLILMQTSQVYAAKAGALWASYLPWTPEQDVMYRGLESSLGDGEGQGGPDWDAIMLYGSSANGPRHADPNINEGLLYGWNFQKPVDVGVGEGESYEIPSNTRPSVGEMARLRKIYGESSARMAV